MFSPRLLAFVLLLTTAALAQDTRATTEDGNSVILHKDGTWTYVQTAKASPAATVQSFHKGAASTRKLPAPHGQFAVYIDPHRWKQQKTEDNKLLLEAASGKAYAMIIADGMSVPTKTMKEVVLHNAQRKDANARVIAQERRIVNNREVLCLQVEATFSGIPFIYFGYYYGGSSGNVQVVTFTPKLQFATEKAEMEEFLNGLEISDSPLPEVSDFKTVPLNDGKMRIAYDSTKWKAPEASEGGKLKLVNNKGNGWVLLIPESVTFPLDSFPEFAFDNVKKLDPDATLVFREKRNVHGHEIWCQKVSANIKGLPFIYYGYYYSGPAGSIQVLGYTTATNFPENEADFTEILNSLEINPNAAAL